MKKRMFYFADDHEQNKRAIYIMVWNYATSWKYEGSKSDFQCENMLHMKYGNAKKQSQILSVSFIFKLHHNSFFFAGFQKVSR